MEIETGRTDRQHYDIPKACCNRKHYTIERTKMRNMKKRSAEKKSHEDARSIQTGYSSVVRLR